jgi:hypothetical protein
LAYDVSVAPLVTPTGESLALRELTPFRLQAEDEMKQPYYSSELAALELDLEIRSRLFKYGIRQPKFDDNDRLRAYLVILDLEKKAGDMHPWQISNEQLGDLAKRIREISAINGSRAITQARQVPRNND